MTIETSRRAHDVHFVLADADSLDDHHVLARRIEDERRVARRRGKPSKVAACRHAANEYAGVVRVRAHADAVAQNRAAGEWTGRIDSQHPDRTPGSTRHADQPIDERALADTGGTGHANDIGTARVLIEATDQRRSSARIVLHDRDRTSHPAWITGEDEFGNGVGRGTGRHYSS